MPYCIVFIITLFVKGLGMPLNHYLFHSSFRELFYAASIAITLKLTFVIGMEVQGRLKGMVK
jgi:hypothetical protein